jgi:hypothetical protein
MPERNVDLEKWQIDASIKVIVIILPIIQVPCRKSIR